MLSARTPKVTLPSTGSRITRRGPPQGVHSEMKSTDDPRDDIQLLKLIAREQDQGAMAVLFRRHQTAAFNLARRISRSRDEADDIVQEAMLTVWNKAGSFEARGEVRSWLLRIVAFKGLQAVKKEQRAKKRIEKLKKTGNVVPAIVSHAHAEKAEIMTALQSELESLPEQERQLLALHYGGGLSHREIATSLLVARQEVDAKCKRALEKMRRNLSQAGFASTATILVADSLATAFCSGQSVSEGLTERVLTSIEQTANASASTTGMSGKPFMAILVSSTILLTSGLWLSQKNDEASHSPTRSPAPSNLQTNQAIGENEISTRLILKKRWTFENGIPKDFKRISGPEWKWQPGKNDNPGAIKFSDRDMTTFMLPTGKLPKRPLLLEIDLRVPANVTGDWFWTCGVLRTNENGDSFPHRGWKRAIEFSQARRHHYKAYLTSRHIIELFGERNLFLIQADDKAFEGDRVVLELKNWVVERIELREISLGEIPEHLRIKNIPAKDFKPVPLKNNP